MVDKMPHWLVKSHSSLLSIKQRQFKVFLQCTPHRLIINGAGSTQSVLRLSTPHLPYISTLKGIFLSGQRDSPPYTNLSRTPSTPDFYSIPHHQLLYIINSTTPPFPTPPPVSLSPSACHPHTLHSGWGGRRTCAADGGVGHFPNQWRERRVVGCIDINSK